MGTCVLTAIVPQLGICHRCTNYAHAHDNDYRWTTPPRADIKFFPRPLEGDEGMIILSATGGWPQTLALYTCHQQPTCLAAVKKKSHWTATLILRQLHHPCAQYAATRQPAITSGRRAAKVAKDSSDEALEAAGATNVARGTTARSTK